MTAGIRVLGPLEAEVEGARADLGGPLQRAVLALLLMERGRVVSVDRMIDQLWPGEPPPRAIASLQAYVSNLRGPNRRAAARRRRRPAGALDALLDPDARAAAVGPAPGPGQMPRRTPSRRASGSIRRWSPGRGRLRQAAATRPVAVLLDDLHQADVETLALLETVAAGLAGSPLLLMAAYRPAERRRRAGAGPGRAGPALAGPAAPGRPARS